MSGSRWMDDQNDDPNLMWQAKIRSNKTDWEANKTHNISYHNIEVRMRMFVLSSCILLYRFFSAREKSECSIRSRRTSPNVHVPTVPVQKLIKFRTPVDGNIPNGILLAATERFWFEFSLHSHGWTELQTNKSDRSTSGWLNITDNPCPPKKKWTGSHDEPWTFTVDILTLYESCWHCMSQLATCQHS